MVRHFFLAGIELQKARIGVCLLILVPELQVSLPEDNLVIFRELNFKEALSYSRYNSFRDKWPSEINRQVFYGYVRTTFKVEGGNMSGEKQLRTLTFDGEVFQAFHLEGYTLHGRIVVADVLVLLVGLVRLDPERVSRQNQPGGFNTDTVVKGGPDRRHRVRFRRLVKIILQVDNPSLGGTSGHDSDCQGTEQQ